MFPASHLKHLHPAGFRVAVGGGEVLTVEGHGSGHKENG